MGTTTPAVTLYARIRQIVSMDVILCRYRIQVIECGENEHMMQCNCPLPAHPAKKKGKTFRIYGDGMRFPRWKCFSKTCAIGRAHSGHDVITFVALMENCDLPKAAEKILGWIE